MKFDWSMVKAKPAAYHDAPDPRPAPMDAPRVLVPPGAVPVAAPPGMNLLEFIEWCVPDDGTPLPEPFVRLFDSLDPSDENTVQPPSPR